MPPFWFSRDCTLLYQSQASNWLTNAPICYFLSQLYCLLVELSQQPCHLSLDSWQSLHKQMLEKWRLHQQGVSIVVRSFNKERMKENLQIFDWELGDDELAKIGQIPQRRGFSGQSFVHHDGPYKSLEELWNDDAWRAENENRLSTHSRHPFVYLEIIMIFCRKL